MKSDSSEKLRNDVAGLASVASLLGDVTSEGFVLGCEVELGWLLLLAVGHVHFQEIGKVFVDLALGDGFHVFKSSFGIREGTEGL